MHNLSAAKSRFIPLKKLVGSVLDGLMLLLLAKSTLLVDTFLTGWLRKVSTNYCINCLFVYDSG
jgi:hypothetical protein